MKAALKLPTLYFLAAIGGAAALAIGLGYTWFAHACLLDALGIQRAAIAARASAEERARAALLMEHILPLGLADDLYGIFESARYTAAQIRGARFIGYERDGRLWVGHHRAILDELASFLVSRTENPA